jgi:hypothetical protein
MDAIEYRSRAGMAGPDFVGPSTLSPNPPYLGVTVRSSLGSVSTTPLRPRHQVLDHEAALPHLFTKVRASASLSGVTS